MMRLFWIIGISSTIGFGCAPTNKDDRTITVADIDTENPPILTLDKDLHDFGKIAQGEKVMHTFKFENTGKSNLILSSVTAGCGCTVPKNWPKHPIAPGETGEITIEYTGTGNGAIRKSLSILANTRPATTLAHIKVHVAGPESE